MMSKKRARNQTRCNISSLYFLHFLFHTTHKRLFPFSPLDHSSLVSLFEFHFTLMVSVPHMRDPDGNKRSKLCFKTKKLPTTRMTIGQRMTTTLKGIPGLQQPTTRNMIMMVLQPRLNTMTLLMWMIQRQRCFMVTDQET